MNKTIRKALVKWFDEYQDYAVATHLDERPKAVKLDGMPKEKGYKEPDFKFIQHHTHSEEANRRLRVIQSMKDIGDEYALYGDVLYYRYMLNMPIDEVCQRLSKYHQLLDYGVGTKHIPNPTRVSYWSTKALKVAADILPEEWYLYNEPAW